MTTLSWWREVIICYSFFLAGLPRVRPVVRVPDDGDAGARVHAAVRLAAYCCLEGKGRQEGAVVIMPQLKAGKKAQ